MGMSQGNSLNTYNIKHRKMSFFVCLFLKNWRTGGHFLSGKVAGKDVAKCCRRVNMVQICIHMYVNGKMRPIKTIPGLACTRTWVRAQHQKKKKDKTKKKLFQEWVEGEMKENGGGGEFNYDIFET
jgi:hypothetical protein